MAKKILACGTHLGSVNAIKPVIEELVRRGHCIDVYATGTESQARNFGNIPYEHKNLSQDDCDSLLKNYDMVLVGMSGVNTPDAFFLKSASRKKIPSVAVPDLDVEYTRLGTNLDYFPTLLSIMNPQCKDTIRKESPNDYVAEELIRKARIIGWTIFDPLASLRENFSEENRNALLTKLGLNPEKNYPVHFTQVISPKTEYMNSIGKPFKLRQKKFDYEFRATEKIFGIASDLGLKLLIKPHPGEEFEKNYTLDLVKKYDFIYIPAEDCDTKQLILSASSVSGGKTTCIVESCLLDKNTGGLFPELSSQDVAQYPSITKEAIPYTFEWEKVGEIFNLINSSDPETNKKLMEQRKKFSVDGKASKRLVDMIEEEIF